MEDIRGEASNKIIVDDVCNDTSVVSFVENDKPMSPENIKKWATKGNITRNSLCPCGSGRKVKKCHSQYLDIRHYVVQNEINILNGLAAHNRAAGMEKSGYHRMNREQFIESLQNKEN